MITFTLGTIHYPFYRLLNWLQKLLDQHQIYEKIALQYGSTPIVSFEHSLVTSFQSISPDKMEKYINNSSLVISHAGQGSTRALIEKQASFVLIPRRKCFGEHVDDHQLWFARTVAKYGIPYCLEYEQLLYYIKNPPSRFKERTFHSSSLAEYLVHHYNNVKF